MPDEQTDVNAAAPSTAEPNIDVSNPADASAADAVEPSLDDLLEQAFKGKEDAAPSDEQDTQAAETKEPEADDLPDEPTEDELKEAKNPRTRQRIETLLDQRREARAEAEALKPKAAQWDQIEKFRTEHGLKPETVANSIQIAALVENDPAKALELLRPVWNSLMQRAGDLLPEELEQRVRQGEIARQDALRITRAEATRKTLEAETARRRQEQTEREARDRVESQTTVLANASSKWDQEQAARDPDWSSKRQMVADIVAAKLAQNVPDTPQGMIEVLNDASKKVNDLLGKFRQPAPAVPRDPDGASSRAAKPRAPKDFDEVLNMAFPD